MGRYIAAPHGLKPEQRAYLENTFKTILARPDVAQRFENAGSIATWKSGDDLRKMFEAYIPEGQSMVDFYKKSQK
ncbi:hypothetical protein [uncultured Desulfovibrio sp.]|uniref:hypothetical protein n=1 Tax=uncultured Desulfovibrio sp. TaxID=167968 RepID=UPI00351D84DC